MNKESVETQTKVVNEESVVTQTKLVENTHNNIDSNNDETLQTHDKTNSNDVKTISTDDNSNSTYMIKLNQQKK